MVGLDGDRPGGLSEREDNVAAEDSLGGADQQDSNSIPRRLVARCCVEALLVPASIGRIIEVTSDPDLPQRSMQEALT